MSCCCCSPQGAGITAGGVLAVIAIALIVTHLAAILHFLLIVLIGVLAIGTVTVAAGAILAWRMHLFTNAATDSYTVEQVRDHSVIEGEVIQEGIDGTGQKALEASTARGIPFGFAEIGGGDFRIPVYTWADGSPVWPVRHSERQAPS